METKRRHFLNTKMSHIGSGAPEGRSLLKGKCHSEKQVGEYRAGLWQSRFLSLGKGRSLFQGIYSFQWGELGKPLLIHLSHIILSIFQLCQILEDKTHLSFPPLPMALPPPEAGTNVRSISSSCLSETSCSLGWTW